jgi:hypothetical protein
MITTQRPDAKVSVAAQITLVRACLCVACRQGQIKGELSRCNP